MMNQIFFLIGASGAGKTTVAAELEKHGTNIQVCYFDSIGVPTLEEMERDYGGGEEWQRIKTIEWVRDIKDRYLSEKDVVLDAQTRPSFIQEGCKEAGIESYKIILFDCSDEVRKERLTDRGQPELATEHMMNWGKFLRQECQNERCLVVDTSSLTIDESVRILRKAIGKLETKEGIDWNVR